MIKEEQIGTVESFAFGGQGIVRQNGLVIFIPFTAPGDVVKYVIKSKKKSFAEGQLISVISSSTQRTTPHCVHFGACGGCQLQHLEYAEQLKHKRQWVMDALTRIGGLDHVVVEPAVPAEERWAYRRRITLTLAPYGESYRLVYHGVEKNQVVEATECLIFAERENRLIEKVRAFLQKLVPVDDTEAKVSIISLESAKQYSIHVHFKYLPKKAQELAKLFLEDHPEFIQLAMYSSNHSFQLGKEMNEWTQFACEGLKFNFSPVAFVQNHPEQSEKIYREICRIASLKPRKHILDLYCGIGVSTLLLGKANTVTGVELNKDAISFAQSNRAANKLNHSVNFIEGDVDLLAEKLMKKIKPDFLLVNPPRTGLAKSVLKSFQSHQPDEIVYVSCMPTTLARDLKVLTDQGYKITFCQPFDMFPQTTHVEVLAVLQKDF